jgi:hypothetical protein
VRLPLCFHCRTLLLLLDQARFKITLQLLRCCHFSLTFFASQLEQSHRFRITTAAATFTMTMNLSFYFLAFLNATAWFVLISTFSNTATAFPLQDSSVYLPLFDKLPTPNRLQEAIVKYNVQTMQPPLPLRHRNAAATSLFEIICKMVELGMVGNDDKSDNAIHCDCNSEDNWTLSCQFHGRQLDICKNLVDEDKATSKDHHERDLKNEQESKSSDDSSTSSGTAFDSNSDSDRLQGLCTANVSNYFKFYKNATSILPQIETFQLCVDYNSSSNFLNGCVSFNYSNTDHNWVVPLPNSCALEFASSPNSGTEDYEQCNSCQVCDQVSLGLQVDCANIQDGAVTKECHPLWSGNTTNGNENAEKNFFSSFSIQQQEAETSAGTVSLQWNVHAALLIGVLLAWYCMDTTIM